MRSVSLLASITQGVELSSTVFRSALRSSIDTSVESLRSLEFHSFNASAISEHVRRIPSATAAENIAAEAANALSESSLRNPGSAVATYHTGFSQNCSVTRASEGISGSCMVNVVESGEM